MVLFKALRAEMVTWGAFQETKKWQCPECRNVPTGSIKWWTKQLTQKGHQHEASWVNQCNSLQGAMISSTGSIHSKQCPSRLTLNHQQNLSRNKQSTVPRHSGLSRRCPPKPVLGNHFRKSRKASLDLLFPVTRCLQKSQAKTVAIFQRCFISLPWTAFPSTFTDKKHRTNNGR